MLHTKGLTLPLILLQTILMAFVVVLLFRIDSNVDLIAEDARTTYFLNIEEHRGTAGIEVFALPIYGNTLFAANLEFDQQFALNNPVVDDISSCPECVFDLPDSSIFLLYKDIETNGESVQTLVRDTTVIYRK